MGIDALLPHAKKAREPKRRPLPVLSAATVGIGLVGLFDWVTGVDLRVFPLYFLPLAYGAWWLPRRLTLILALLATAAWVVANIFEDVRPLGAWTWVFNAISQFIAFGALGFLISELRRRLRDESSLSRRDPLTGLFNSRGFRERSALLLEHACRQNLPVTIAYIDLDNFKAVNDQQGHEAGDAALNVVADALRRNSRSTDLVARVGGDEFVLLLLEADLDTARVVLERLRQQVGAVMAARGWPVTVSVGAHVFMTPPVNERDALRHADALMYRAKREGKDRVYLELAPA